MSASTKNRLTVAAAALIAVGSLAVGRSLGDRGQVIVLVVLGTVMVVVLVVTSLRQIKRDGSQGPSSDDETGPTGTQPRTDTDEHLR